MLSDSDLYHAVLLEIFVTALISVQVVESFALNVEGFYLNMLNVEAFDLFMLTCDPGDNFVLTSHSVC